MAITPMGGIGLTPMFGSPEPGKKFSSAECLEALMQKISDEPNIVKNQFNLIISSQVEEMRDVFWPAIFEAANWTRVATHRPSHDENGEKLTGTDREVREYENDVWFDASKALTGKVTTEFGEIIGFEVIAKW
jgi:hypothetical protein